MQSACLGVRLPQLSSMHVGIRYKVQFEGVPWDSAASAAILQNVWSGVAAVHRGPQKPRAGELELWDHSGSVSIAKLVWCATKVQLVMTSAGYTVDVWLASTGFLHGNSSGLRPISEAQVYCVSLLYACVHRLHRPLSAHELDTTGGFKMPLTMPLKGTFAFAQSLDKERLLADACVWACNLLNCTPASVLSIVRQPPLPPAQTSCASTHSSSLSLGLALGPLVSSLSFGSQLFDDALLSTVSAVVVEADSEDADVDIVSLALTALDAEIASTVRAEAVWSAAAAPVAMEATTPRPSAASVSTLSRLSVGPSAAMEATSPRPSIDPPVAMEATSPRPSIDPPVAMEATSPRPSIDPPVAMEATSPRLSVDPPVAIDATLPRLSVDPTAAMSICSGTHKSKKRKQSDGVSDECLTYVQHWFVRQHWSGMRIRVLVSLGEKSWVLDASRGRTDFSLLPELSADVSIGQSASRFCVLLTKSTLQDEDVYDYLELLS